MKRGTVRTILFAVAFSVFLFSGFMLLKSWSEMRAGAAFTASVVQMAIVETAEPSVGTAAEETVNETAETAPIAVDFDMLRAQNEDVVGWLYCPDTPINYPVAQASDNEYYLHRLLDGSKNSAGTLFLDYRNAENLSDWNSVIYGHNMNNDTMFGTLTEYKTQSYFEAHPRMYLLTPERDYAIDLVAGFVTPADAAMYRHLRPNEAEKAELLKSWLDQSDFKAERVPTAEEHLITLSTCSYEYNDARYVLVGVLK